MKISSKGLKLIKEFEGYHSKAYKDPVGVWTIGYGVTNSDKDVIGKTIKAGMTITKAIADEWLKECIDKKYGPLVEKYADVYHWNQNEFDALCSFCYNIGSIKQLTADGTRTKAEVGDMILAYNKATVDGKKMALAGLTRRRQAEQDLFLTPVKEGYKGKFPVLPARGYFKYGDGITSYTLHIPQIKRVQEILNWALNEKLVVDGMYGTKTDKAVEKLQKKAKIPVNGCYGNKCQAYLKKLKK